MRSIDMQLSAISTTRPPAAIRSDVAVVRMFATLLAFQGIGELLARVMRVPVPGPVIGMVLLAALLAASPSTARTLEGPALGLLNHLSLLFIPAGVGVVVLASTLKGQMLAILLAIAISTAVSVVVTGVVTCALLERRKRIESSAVATPNVQQ
jgi:holin-like protein